MPSLDPLSRPRRGQDATRGQVLCESFHDCMPKLLPHLESGNPLFRLRAANGGSASLPALRRVYPVVLRTKESIASIVDFGTGKIVRAPCARLAGGWSLRRIVRNPGPKDRTPRQPGSPPLRSDHSPVRLGSG